MSTAPPPADLICAKAQELGFDLVRFAGAELPEKYHRAFARWIAAERHGAMGYLERRLTEGKTLDVLLPGAQSAIVLGANYYREEDVTPTDGGQVSRYAVTRDYHKVLGKKLKVLGKWLEQDFQVGTRWYVDTGPILERAYAEMSGMGYIGRNTCVISKEHGSWIFLAVILTTLELPPSENTLRIRCGSCRRCVDACPTGAILEDHTLDARRCISYLTIENREGIPMELREGMGNWIFGCDICQEVCPHNHRATAARLDELQQIRVGDRRLDLSEILRVPDHEAFTAMFAGTPLMRAKRRGMVRNACVVAGNSGDPRLIPVLTELCERESDAMLVEHAEWAIAKLS